MSSILPCPYLPVPERPYTVEDIQALGRDRGPAFYDTALHYAQTLWLEGFPAKSLLLINRALSCHLPGVSLQSPARPYHAVAWLLHNRPANLFIGNPRRHYQHLATRMVEPHKPLRTWRAWACWSLSRRLLPEEDCPADHKQIMEEGIIEPRHADIRLHLQELSPCDDAEAWQQAFAWAEQQSRPRHPAISDIAFLSILPEDLPRVQNLARRIWPAVYPPIISKEQIHYMLETMYALPVLRQEIRERGIHYAIIQTQQKDAGYLAWEPNPGARCAFIHKLYVLPELHGRGIGAHALQWIHAEAAKQQLQRVALRVNKNNHAAIRAYLREGYHIEQSLCSDIGQGFVMDDFLMSRDLPPSA